MDTDLTRRKLCKTTCLTLAMIPVVLVTRHAGASVNKPVRVALKYQDTPKDDMTCTTCLDFIPGKNDKAPGGCKLIPRDDEISPNGYCDKWNTM